MHKILPGQKRSTLKIFGIQTCQNCFSLTPQIICVPHYGPWYLMSVPTFIGQPRIFKHSISSHFPLPFLVVYTSPVVLWVVFLSLILEVLESGNRQTTVCQPKQSLWRLPLCSGGCSFHYSQAAPPPPPTHSMELWLSNHHMHQWQQFLWTRNSNSEPLWNLASHF